MRTRKRRKSSSSSFALTPLSNDLVGPQSACDNPTDNKNSCCRCSAEISVEQPELRRTETAKSGLTAITINNSHHICIRHLKHSCPFYENELTSTEQHPNVACQHLDFTSRWHQPVVAKCSPSNKEKLHSGRKTARRKINQIVLKHYLRYFLLAILIKISIIYQSNIVNCERLFKLDQRQQSPAFPLPINYQIPQQTNTAPVQRFISSPQELIAQHGGIIKDKNIVLTKQNNPIVIKKDIVIKRDAKLTIESGSELLFDKKKGIIVYGTLEILGHPNDKVKLNLLKSQQSATINFRSQSNNQQQPQRQQQQQVRLVDGDLPSEGRVQIKFNDKWHSLCTNSKNLTASDIKVLCRQVGYQEGAWYKWFPKRNETTFQVMTKSFHCGGEEATVTHCRRWNRIRSGGGVCDNHSDIGVRCSKKIVFQQDDLGNTKSVPIYDYWRGIEFVNSETQQEYVLDGQMKQKVSRSKLHHLIISEAGLDDVGNATAAIRVYGQPPRLNDIEIRNSIYGIMIEDVTDVVTMSNIRLTNNIGYPLFVNSSWGKISLDHMHVENNGGDGIRIVRHEKTSIGSHDFCKFANLGTSQSYPVILSHEQQFLTSGNDCCQEFISHNQLTVHFPVLRSTPNNLLPESDNNRRISVPPGVELGKDANLVIYDDYRDEFPFRLRIQNGTRAQSIVSKSGRLKICYEPASYRTVLFTVEVVADVDGDEDVILVGNREERGTGIAQDVEISNSYIRRNEGRGIWVDNQRSGVRIFNTTVIQHNYLSGVHVENGTGEVIIQASQISNNTGHGLYINLAGGYYHIDNSTITGNTLSGIAIEYDKRSELVPFNHTMHIGYSLIAHNGENGLFIGNVCRSDAFWNISMNSFIKNGEEAIVFESCQPTHDNVHRFYNLTSRLNTGDQDPSLRNAYQELFITHNVFLENFRRAIKLAPVFFVKSFIRHNLFKDHPLAVLYINNRAFEDQLNNSTAAASVNIRIASNRFYTNRGRYVANIGLQEDSPKQALMFTKNYLEDNYITEPYTDLRPRSRVSAVVVVSSSNTKVVRNRFINPRSNYEMGSHLEVHSKIINATANFWGHGLDASSIYRRIFDRKNRYNLAQVEFLQYLLSPEDLEYITDLSFDRERDKITTYKNGTRLGGEVKGFEELQPDTYVVHDDIFIRPGGHLILKPGTVIKFHDGVGLMVQGRLDALGHANSPIQFTSISPSSRMPQKAAITTTTTMAPYANPWVSHQPDGSSNDDNDVIANRSSANTSSSIRRFTRQSNFPTSSVNNVRLSHTTMGRLEVQIDGFWGPVCDYNFDINDAAVVCQQLGMILNKDDWMLERFQYAANDQQQLSMMTADALMTNLRCDPALDTDVTACKAEISSRGDFDGICNSEVGIRCFPPSWSGIRLGMGAETSTLENVVIQRAGMFDYANYALRPALQIDFNRHWLSSLLIKSNSDSGLGVMFNDVIGRHFNELSIVDSRFVNNEKHGIELRSRGLTIKGCTMSTNRQNGLDYNPSMSDKELDDLLSWLQTARNSDNVVHITFPIRSSSNHFSVPSSEESYRFFVLPKNPQANLKETFTIGTDPGHMLSIHLMSPINQDSTEVLNMSLGLNSESPIWDLSVNTTSFPMISPGYKFHFNYTSGSRPLGNVVLYVRSRYNNRDLKVLTKFIPPHLVMSKFDQTATNINSKLINSLVISNCTLVKNGIGLKFRHSNYAYGPRSVFNRRYANETTNITNNIFDSNYFSSIFIASDEQDISSGSSKMETPTSEIRFNVLDNKIRRNRDGIRQFSRDIRQSHNVFHWTINGTIFEQNRGGGINIVLPYYWKYDLNMSHTIEMSNNSFLKNTNFELGVEGHYAILNVTNNMFRENRCRNRLIGFSGMEKQLLFRHNIIENNICNRIVDFNIHSHADKMGSVPTAFEFNALRHNMRLLSNSTYAHLTSNFRFPKLLPKLHPLATDYALALRGVQALNITRNIFFNPELRFELVVAIIMDPDERTVNAIENYWGSVVPSDISERIFDFDDWNSYALAELSPILIRDSFFAASMIAEARDLRHTMTTQSLGGRLMRSMVLPFRKEPYIIESDFTIMPNVRLTIDRGVVLEFMPNVGILVLGELIAAGSRDKPIQMRPVLAGSDVVPLRQYLFPTKTRPNITQTGLSDPLSYEHNYAFKHYRFSYSIDMGSVRLCKNEICNDGSHIYENNVEDPVLRQEVLDSTDKDWKMDGFLEIYNMTTLQWVPICDPLFTEHSAKTVCRQLGYTHLSLFKRGRRYTIEQEQVSSVKNWPQSVQCDGDESNLSSCPLAATGFMNHSTACHREGNQFIYVYCRDFPDYSINGSARNRAASNEHLHHWGGIRFSCPNRASKDSLTSTPSQYYNTSSNTNNIGSRANGQTRSLLQYVSIDRAGLLHRKKAPAIQVLQCIVHLEYVTVTNSAHHGIEMITSNANQNFHQLRIKNNLGVGINYLSLTGSSSATRLVPYLPLKHLDLSSDIFGLVDVCGANKEIRIDERILLFYRYNSRPVDCVKIIKSKLSIKHLGIRMLQFDLFNSTALTSRPDHLRIYDGNVFDPDSRLLVELGVEESHRLERPELKFYQSSDSSMTIRLHASGAGPYQGFIAEVVTTPISYNVQRDLYNNVTFSDISNNKLGALTVSSAGESTPNLMIRNNRFDSNCLHLFGNFTSCLVPIHMELQNCQKLKLNNNLIRANIGGLIIKSYSRSAIAALDASIENNVFEANQNTYTLALLGPKTDPYQRVNVIDNFFTRNVARYLPNIVLSNIVANFSDNIVSGNIGKHQIEVVGFEKLPLSYQSFYNNWIYNNTATFERDQSTISSNSAGQQFNMNYFVNPDNHFEISTKNWSRYDVRPFQVPRDDEMIHLASGDGSTKDVMRKTADLIPLNIIDAKRLDLYQATIDAKHNWWGFNSTYAIQGRIRDRAQHEELIKVDFAPFLETNRSILSGICSGGWQRVNGACLVYIGTRMTYQEARDFCDRERATIPLLRGNHIEFTEFIESQDPQYDARIDRIWVRSFDVSRDACPALNDYRTKNYDCQDRYAFLCEKDPQVVVSFMFWYRERAGLLVLFLAFVTIILTCCCSVCWLYKSRQRHKEKISRKNSLYASMRSNRAGPYSSNNSLSELFLHRQLYNTDKQPSIVYSSSSTTLSSIAQQGSDDMNNLVRLNPAANSRSSARFKKQQTGSSKSRGHHQEQGSIQKRHQSSAPKLSPKQDQRQQQHSRQNDFYKQQQVAYNPDYVSQDRSYPMERQHSRDELDYNMMSTATTPVPAPSNREQHPRMFAYGSAAGSRTPSLAGSFTNDQILSDNPLPLETFHNQQNNLHRSCTDVVTGQFEVPHREMRKTASRTRVSSTPNNEFQFEPLPPPPPVAAAATTIAPPPPLSYKYSDILFNQNGSAINAGNNNDYTFKRNLATNNRVGGLSNDEARLIQDMAGSEEDSSSHPTFYNNQIESFEESTNSYLETYNVYNDTYRNELQPINNGDQVSLVLTEQSSITDLITTTRTIEKQLNLISMHPEGGVYSNSRVGGYGAGGIRYGSDLSDNLVVGAGDRSRFHISHSSGNLVNNNNGADGGTGNSNSNNNFHGKAASDAGSLKSNRSNMMETSFDFDAQTIPMASSYQFDGSQRLSPVSSSFAPSDSKLGSRVYLETTFE